MLEEARRASVVALIVDKSGAIVAVGVKGFEEGGCGHAEVKAMFSLKGHLPEGGAVFSTLKPCTMCAGLLHGLDPGSNLRKYWGREDSSAAANWRSKDVELELAHAYALDKDCPNVKYLKLPGNMSFLEGFAAERNKTWTATDDQDVFNAWWPKYKLPKDVGLIHKSSSPRKLLTNPLPGRPPSQPFKEAKAAITRFADINQENLGHVEQHGHADRSCVNAAELASHGWLSFSCS